MFSQRLLLWQLNISNVMSDLIRHPGQFWIPAGALPSKLLVGGGNDGFDIYCRRSNNKGIIILTYVIMWGIIAINTNSIVRLL